MTRADVDPSLKVFREWLAVGIVMLGVGGDVLYHWWDGWADSRVTAGQVVALTGQVTALTGQVTVLAGQVSTLGDRINSMPSTRTTDALAARVDRDETAIGDIRQSAATMRADVDNLMHPLSYRNPKN